MAYHPLNLALRFMLELAALVSMGMWGWRMGDGWVRFVFAGAIPLVAAAVWGTFAVPEDASRSGSAPIAVPGLARLVLELAILGFGVWTLGQAGFSRSSWVLGAIVVAHYAVSYERITWLLTR